MKIDLHHKSFNFLSNLEILMCTTIYSTVQFDDHNNEVLLLLSVKTYQCCKVGFVGENILRLPSSLEVKQLQNQ